MRRAILTRPSLCSGECFNLVFLFRAHTLANHLIAISFSASPTPNSWTATLNAA